MKKYLSIILALSLILSCFSFVSSSAATTYEKPDSYTEMSGLIEALGIADENFVNENRDISRGEFVKLIVNTSGLSEYVSSSVNNAPFTDVPADSEFAPYIQIAKDNKLALGYTDGTFKPEGNVSLIEAIVYLIRLLGYTDVAESNGGYPGGYHQVAFSVNLLKNVNITLDSNVSVACAVNLIFNALNTKVLAISSFKGDSYAATEGPTLMYKNFKIIKVKGIVEGVDLTSLMGPNTVSPYNIKINGVYIDVADISANSFLGYNVNAYYQVTEINNILKYICENTGENNVISVKISEITNIANYTVYETDNEGKVKSYKYTRGAAIVYNGVSTTAAFNMSIFNNDDYNALNSAYEGPQRLQGEVKLLDNNDDNVADVIFIEAYKEFIVGKVDKSANILYDYNNASINVKLDTKTDDPYTVIYNAAGEEIEINKLKEGASVIVYKSHAKPKVYQEYIRAYFSEQTITGVVDSRSSDAENPTCVIGGKEYPLTDYANHYFSNNLIGATVVANVNSLGEICYIKASDNTGTKWGLLRAVKAPSNPSQSYIFEIFTDAGEFAIFNPAKNIVVDNVRINTENPSAMSTLFTNLRTAASKIYQLATNAGDLGFANAGLNDAALCQMVKYRVNNDDKITYIDTVLKEDGTMAKRADMTENNEVYGEYFKGITPYLNGDLYIGWQYRTSADKKAFLYHDTDKSKYSVVSSTVAYTTAMDRSAYGYAFYSMSNSIYPDVFMKSANGAAVYGITYSNNYAIVQKTTSAVDSEGMPAVKVYAYVNGALTNFFAPSGLTSTNNSSLTSAPVMVDRLKEGDIINVAYDSVTGNFKNFEIVYEGTGALSTTEMEVDLAYVYEVKNDGFIYQAIPDNAPNQTAATTFASGLTDYRTVGAKAGTLMVYDSSRPVGSRLRQGTFADLYGYVDSYVDESGNPKVSKIFIHTYSTKYYRPIDIIIYK